METRWKRKLVVLLLTLFGVAVCCALLYLLVVLNWSYAQGERVGYVQRFVRTGWVCKTWEGELTMYPVVAMQPEKFFFTVREEVVAQELNRSLGKKVAIKYEEHKGVPGNCFGETPYYVIEVRVLE